MKRLYRDDNEAAQKKGQGERQTEIKREERREKSHCCRLWRMLIRQIENEAEEAAKKTKKGNPSKL